MTSPKPPRKSCDSSHAFDFSTTSHIHTNTNIHHNATTTSHLDAETSPTFGLYPPPPLHPHILQLRNPPPTTLPTNRNRNPLFRSPPRSLLRLDFPISPSRRPRRRIPRCLYKPIPKSRIRAGAVPSTDAEIGVEGKSAICRRSWIGCYRESKGVGYGEVEGECGGGGAGEVAGGLFYIPLPFLHTLRL